MTQSGYFRLVITLELGMDITDGKILLCHGTWEENGNKKILTKEYNNRTVYDCFNNPFIADFVRTYLNLTPITTDDKPHIEKNLAIP